MKVLQLKDQVILVDDLIYEWLLQWHWSVEVTGYAIRWGYKKDGESYKDRKGFKMHRLIVEKILGRELDPKEFVDHIDGNRLNNCIGNLRLVSNQQNSYNRQLSRNNKSGYKGVYWKAYRKPGSGKWSAEVAHNGKQYFLGNYEDKIEAARAYDKKAKELFGEHAWVNNV